jgi:glutathione S-transferase
VNRTLDVVTSLAASLSRLGGGLRVAPLGRRPEQPLELYEFEACPYCRKVREALTALDLEALVYPCPKGGRRFRPTVRERGGKEQFPFLVDPNTGKAMYESDEIVRYLFERYGRGGVPFLSARGVLNDATAALASAWRPGRGGRAEPSRPPAQPLELWSFESSPFCRIAREKLCSLEIPYRLHNVGKGSPSRPAFERRSGRMMVPYLADPNTQVEMFESGDIVAYLEATYGSPA